MGNPTIQTPPPSNLIRFPLPPSIHSKSNEPIAYFPPLKLGHSRDSPPPLLFPLVPTQQMALKGSDCTGTSLGAVPNNDGAEELPNPRDSWSYWTGGKANLGKPHISEQIQDEDALDICRTGGGEPDAGLAELRVPKLDSEAQPVPDLMGLRSSEKHLQLTPNQSGQVNEAQLSGPDSSEGIGNPQSASSVALPPAQQPEKIRIESPTMPLPSYRYSPHRHMANESPYSTTSNLQGERSQSTQNQRTYSLTMSSHPFHLAQPSRTSGRQMRGFLLQGSSTIANGRQINRMKPGPCPAPDPLQKRYPVRHLPSGINHSRAFEKHLLRNSSGRLASNKNNQYSRIGQPAMLYTNSYQPPRGSLPISKRYNTRSLRSDGSTNFSYPRTYSDPPRYKRRSSGSTHSSTGYGDRFVALGNGVNGSCRGYGTTGGVAKMMGGGNRESVLRDFQDHLRIQSDMAPDVELTQFNGGTRIVSRRSSLQSQSPHRSNFFIPDRPTASPVRNSNYQSTNELCDEMSPFDRDLPSSSWKNSRMSLDGEVQDNGPTTGHVYPNIVLPPGGAEEEACLENIEFTTTVDAASRPYTPDQFVVEAGLTHHSSNATGSLGKKSVGSRGSIRNIRRRSVGSAGSIYAASRNSSDHGRNVLRKQKPLYSVWPNLNPTRKGPWNAGDGSIPPSRASTAPVGNRGIVDTFRERKRLAKELQDAVGHPHTAKTCAGPTRGVVRGNSPSAGIRPGVYQPDASESRLNSLAREGRAKYEATTREIRLHIAARNEFERVGRIDTLSSTDNQGSTNFGKHKNSENPSTMKSDNILQLDTTRIITETIEEPQAINLDAVEIKSPTPASGYIYLSTVYHEGQRMVEKIWERGIGGRFANVGSKQNNTARNLRYGSAGKKVKVYMRGARSESLTVFEKIGKNFGIRKGKESTPVEPSGVDSNENDPFGIDVCGAVDITGGREQTGDSSELSERGFNGEPPKSVWKDFEEGELVDPVKLKLEGEGSKKYWSSKEEVGVKTTWWGKVRNLVKK